MQYSNVDFINTFKNDYAPSSYLVVTDYAGNK